MPSVACEFVILRRVKQPFLIDSDTASDDAVAMIMALRSPQVEVLAITTVAGNVNVLQATRNALYTAELCDSDVPVYVGAEKPLKRAHVGASGFTDAMAWAIMAMLHHAAPRKKRVPSMRSLRRLNLIPDWCWLLLVR